MVYMCFAVCQFWVSDWGGPQDDGVRQPDRRSSLCVWRFGCLLCYSGLPASGHPADTLRSSGRTQGSTWHCWQKVIYSGQNWSHQLLVFSSFFGLIWSVDCMGNNCQHAFRQKSDEMWIWKEINGVTTSRNENDGGNTDWFSRALVSL